MKDRKIDPRQQFSKWLARWTSVFWFLYMAGMAIICALEPLSADAAVYLAIISSTIMLVNVWAYTKNSIYEKAILAGMDLKKIKLSWKNSNGTDGDEELEESEG